jgi:spore germination protein YaaH
MPPRLLHFVPVLLLVIAQLAPLNELRAVSAHAPTAHSASARSGLSREVFGFALASSLADPGYGYPSWNFSLLSTVAFFGLHVSTSGSIVADSDLGVWNSAALTGMLGTAHASGTKVVLTIVLQDFSPGNPSMCSGLANRAVTVQQAVAQVAAKGVDGINVDYEGLNGTCQNGQTTQSMMTDMVRQLRAALPAGAYLSVDTYASSAADSLGFFDVAGLNSYVDSFFVMAYDLEYSNYRYSPPGCGSFCLGPTAPLSGYHYNDVASVGQYSSMVSANKLILGVPYYGRKSCVGGAVPNAYPSSTVDADAYLDASGESTAPGVTSFATHRDANDPSGRERWDTWFNSSMNCTRELYWDDATSLGAKYDLVNADHLRGVGIWTLNYGGGAPELWSALSTHFASCRAVAATVSPSGSASIGNMVAVTATASGCPHASPLYEFWILLPKAPAWQLAQSYSTSAVLQWNTAGAPAGSYGLTVWARDAGSGGAFGNSLGTWDVYAGLTYPLLSIPCSSASVSGSPPAPSVGGTTVSVSATAAGCPRPLYEFWLKAPGGASWQMVQGYSPNAGLQWNTTGAASGSYSIEVWARDASSPNSWDAYGAMQYFVRQPCSSVVIATSPSSSNPPGVTVSLGATGAGCGNPLYEFWLLAPNSSTWVLAQNYSSSATMQWNTSGANPGMYEVAVWLRDANSAGINANSMGRWDAYAFTQYQVTSIPCTSVSLSASPASHAAHGTLVTFTARAAGCPNPLYQFWTLAPGASSWQLAAAYSSTGVLAWNTTGLGPGIYQIAVWIRDRSSVGTAGNASGRWDAYTPITYQIT